MPYNVWFEWRKENVTMKALARAWSPVSLALSCVLASIALCLHADNILLFALEKTGAADLFVCAFLGGALPGRGRVGARR